MEPREEVESLLEVGTGRVDHGVRDGRPRGVAPGLEHLGQCRSLLGEPKRSVVPHLVVRSIEALYAVPRYAFESESVITLDFLPIRSKLLR